MNKFTETDFYDFDYEFTGEKKGRKDLMKLKAVREEEIKSHKAFKDILQSLVSGIKGNANETQKAVIFVKVLKKHPKLTMEHFEHLWDYLKEDASGRVDGTNYMFTDIQGTLWLREAFIQAQYHGP